MKLVLLILFIAPVLFAKAIEPSPVDKQIITFTYNEDYAGAKKITQEQINRNPNTPKYYYYFMNIMILEYYKKVAALDQNNQDEGRKALNKEIIDYGEKVIDKFDVDKLDPENKFYYGMIYAFLARVYGVDRSWWSAFKSGKNARNIMEDVLKADPQFYDPYLVLGMLNYYADRMSGITSFVAGIFGFSGDREKGLTQLQLAYDKGTLTFGQSSLTLIEVYTSLEGNEYKALSYYDAFLKQYPQNKRALNAYCHTLMNILELKKVDSLIQNDKQNLIDDYTKARFNDIKGNSQTAIQYAEKALENENVLFRGGGNACRYIIVYNSWLTGDKTLLNKYESTLSDRYKEVFQEIKSHEKESRWLHELSVKIAAANLSDVENFAKSKPDFKNSKESDDRFNMMMGEFYFVNNNIDKAETLLVSSMNSQDKNVKYNSMKYLIDIYMRKNTDKAKVKTLLSAIDDLDNSRLTYRSRDLEKKYNL